MVTWDVVVNRWIEGGGGLIVTYGRIRKTIDPRIPTMRHTGYYTVQTLLVPSAKRREVLGESHEG